MIEEIDQRIDKMVGIVYAAERALKDALDLIDKLQAHNEQLMVLNDSLIHINKELLQKQKEM